MISRSLLQSLALPTELSGVQDIKAPLVPSYLEYMTRVAGHLFNPRKKLRGVGFEPTRIAPANLKPASLTTRTSPLRISLIYPNGSAEI
jgi:hypothetical protein